MSFGSYLEAAIQRAGLNQRSFAKKVRQKPQAIGAVVKGKRGPPLKHLDLWVSVLGTAVDPKEFKERAQLEHCPPDIRRLVEELRRKGRSVS